MNVNTSAHAWDTDTSDEELTDRLTNLMRQARRCTPIFDDNDLEAAIEEAAGRLTST